MTDDSINFADDNLNSPRKLSPLFTKSQLENLEDLYHGNSHPEISEKLCNAQISSPPSSQVAFLPFLNHLKVTCFNIFLSCS